MPNFDSYEAYGQSRLPRWLRGTWADKWTGIAFGFLDVAIAGVKEALSAGFVAECPDDAVPYHGRASMIDRVGGESIAAWRVRIEDRWTFWKELGPTAHDVDGEPQGLRAVLRLYSGCAGLEVYTQAEHGWAGGATDPVGDGEDANANNASRHAIVIPDSSHTWERLVFGAATLFSPETIWGLDMTSTELSNIRRTYRKHRPTHMVGIDVYVIFDGTAAADVLAEHAVSTDYVRLPLGPYAMFGYPNHGATFGPSFILGHQFI